MNRLGFAGLFIFAICPLPFSMPFARAAAYPAATGYVTDAAGVLEASAENRLDAQLRDFERATSAEIAIVTIASLEGESIEAYAEALFRRWGIGKKGKDNGVLLLVAPNERRMRIEVGYGLEGTLTDGFAGDVIRQIALPRFREGRYAQGLQESVDALQKRIAGEVIDFDSHGDKNRAPSFWGYLGLFAFFWLFYMPGTTLGLVLCFAAFFLNPWGSVKIAALAFPLLGLMIDRRLGFPRRSAFTGHRGWTGGRGFGGGFRGGGFRGGFGGFGGGRSGGGGASGGW